MTDYLDYETLEFHHLSRDLKIRVITGKKVIATIESDDLPEGTKIEGNGPCQWSWPERV